MIPNPFPEDLCEEEITFDDVMILVCDRPKGHDGLHSTWCEDGSGISGGMILWPLTEEEYDEQE